MAVNGSLVIGYQIAGPMGGFMAVLGCIIPPLVMMIIVTYFYQVIVENEYVRIFMRGMQAGVAAMLVDVIIGLFVNVTKKKSVYPFIIMIAAFIFIRFTDYSVFFLVIGCIAVALVKTLLVGKKVTEK